MRHANPFAFGVLLFCVTLCTSCGAAPAVNSSLIAAGGGETCIVKSGAVKCWGKNNSGQLGDGTVEDRNTPVAVTVLPGKAVTVAVGYVHACAVLESGVVFCWGSQSADLSKTGSDPGYSAVAAGSMHTCGLTARGGMKCWGSNSFGGLGDGTTGERQTPVDVIGLSGDVTSVAAGVDFSCAVHKGAAKCWGSDDTGQLGNGGYQSSAEPAVLPGLESGVSAVAAGVFHACALKTNGEIWCWGENLAGELGDGTNQNFPVPVKVINLDGGIQSVVVGGSHTCALTQAGGVKCWGGNSSGQLGDGSTTDRNSPVDVMGLTGGVIAIAAGGSHTCAVLTGGAVKCWGLNENGQLGNGSNQDSSTPVDVRMS